MKPLGNELLESALPALKTLSMIKVGSLDFPLPKPKVCMKMSSVRQPLSPSDAPASPGSGCTAVSSPHPVNRVNTISCRPEAIAVIWLLPQVRKLREHAHCASPFQLPYHLCNRFRRWNHCHPRRSNGSVRPQKEGTQRRNISWPSATNEGMESRRTPAKP